MFYDRSGVPISLDRWLDEVASDLIDETHLGAVEVTTRFLGMNLGGSHLGTPLMYETTVFVGDHGGHVARSGSECDARLGHARTVALVSKAALGWVRLHDPASPPAGLANPGGGAPTLSHPGGSVVTLPAYGVGAAKEHAIAFLFGCHHG